MGMYLPYQVFVKWSIGVMIQIQKANPTKTLPIAQNGVINGDPRNPVICDQSIVSGMTSNPTVNNIKRNYTSERPEDLVQHHVIRSNPSYESKVTQSCKDVTRDPVPKEHPPKAIHEPTVSGDCPPWNLRFLVTM